MKAIVQDRYGSPGDVLELRDTAQPTIKDDEVLVRVRAASVHLGDSILVRGRPYLLRMATGPRKPRNVVPGTDVAGTVEAVGKDVTQLRPGDEVFGWCTGAFAEYACGPADHFVAKPANLTFEQAAAVGRVGDDRAAAPARPGERQGGAEGPDQRRGGRRRDVRRADRQGVRRRGDRRVQHRERGHGPLDRRRPRHRLHAGGLHQGRPALRLHPRQRGEPLDGRHPTCPHVDGHAAIERRRPFGRPLARLHGGRDQGGRVVEVRAPAAPPVGQVPEPEGPGRPQGTRRSWQGHAGHRRHLPVESDRRGDRSRGPGARPRNHRHRRSPE